MITACFSIAKTGSECIDINLLKASSYNEKIKQNVKHSIFKYVYSDIYLCKTPFATLTGSSSVSPRVNFKQGA